MTLRHKFSEVLVAPEYDQWNPDSPHFSRDKAIQVACDLRARGATMLFGVTCEPTAPAYSVLGEEAQHIIVSHVDDLIIGPYVSADLQNREEHFVPHGMAVWQLPEQA